MSTGPRRTPSVSSERFVRTTIAPILDRWRRATTEDEEHAAAAAFVEAVSDEGARRRKDLEDELERARHTIAERDQAVELLTAKVRGLVAENQRLRDSLGGTER